jgi:hypothetical protein
MQVRLYMKADKAIASLEIFSDLIIYMCPVVYAKNPNTICNLSLQLLPYLD